MDSRKSLQIEPDISIFDNFDGGNCESNFNDSH